MYGKTVGHLIAPADGFGLLTWPFYDPMSQNKNYIFKVDTLRKIEVKRND